MGIPIEVVSERLLHNDKICISGAAYFLDHRLR